MFLMKQVLLKHKSVFGFWAHSLPDCRPVFRSWDGRPTKIGWRLVEGGAELWDQVTRRRLRLLIVRSSFSANGVSKQQQQLFGNSCSSGGVSTRSQLGPWVSFLTADLPPTHPPTRPAGCCRKKLLHKSFPFSSVCLGMRAMRCAPLMFLLECSKTTVLSEAPVPSVSGNVCGNHISRYECVLCTHSTSWVTTYNL